MLGGHAVAQCLRNEGVKHVFSVPGESYIAVVDGLVNFPEIKLITNRQEGCAAFMRHREGLQHVARGLLPDQSGAVEGCCLGRDARTGRSGQRTNALRPGVGLCRRRSRGTLRREESRPS